MIWLLAPLFLSFFIVSGVLVLNQSHTNTHRISNKKVSSLDDWSSIDLHVPKDTFLIITTQCTVPEWIVAQLKSLKWVKPKCELVVINDGLTQEHVDSISEACETLKVKQVLFPKEWHKNRTLLFPETQEPKTENAVTRCADTSQAAYVLLQKHGGKGMLLDGDAAFFAPFDPDTYLSNHYLVGYGQDRKQVHYLWNALLLFDFDRMPDQKDFNLDCGVVEDQHVDVGGQLHHYLQAHGGKKGYRAWERYDNIEDWTNQAMLDFYHQAPYGDMMENFEHCIAHARNAGNWNGWIEGIFEKRVEMFVNFISSV